MGGSVGWGLVAGLAAAPIGALAGVLAGGNQKNITFICAFKDGRRFLGSCNAKTYTAIQAAAFISPVAAPASRGRSILGRGERKSLQTDESTWSRDPKMRLNSFGKFANYS
jgi:hypothetical protein